MIVFLTAFSLHLWETFVSDETCEGDRDVVLWCCLNCRWCYCFVCLFYTFTHLLLCIIFITACVCIVYMTGCWFRTAAHAHTHPEQPGRCRYSHMGRAETRTEDHSVRLASVGVVIYTYHRVICGVGSASVWDIFVWILTYLNEIVFILNYFLKSILLYLLRN